MTRVTVAASALSCSATGAALAEGSARRGLLLRLSRRKRARARRRCRRSTGGRPADIAGAMIEFKSGKRPGTIMDRIAKGFSDEEIRAIAAWYAGQK